MRPDAIRLEAGGTSQAVESGQTEESGMERKRVEAVVETLAQLRGRGESVAEVAHDARNMVTALGLYCDLLEEPGVLTPPYRHYGNELRLVAAASRRLVEKLVALDARRASDGSAELAAEPGRLTVRSDTARERQARAFLWEMMPAVPIENLAVELLANRSLLAALAGPQVAVTVDAEGGAQPVRMNGEDLTRVLVNLVKNAAEAMPAGGRIHLSLRSRIVAPGEAAALVLTIEDSGPGIPPRALDTIFDSGFTTRTSGRANGWPASHRGLGLSITRSIVEAAGGRIHAANRSEPGACFEIELPVRAR
jgi:signal transduction histidine kinase